MVTNWFCGGTVSNILAAASPSAPAMTGITFQLTLAGVPPLLRMVSTLGAFPSRQTSPKSVADPSTTWRNAEESLRGGGPQLHEAAGHTASNHSAHAYFVLTDHLRREKGR